MPLPGYRSRAGAVCAARSFSPWANWASARMYRSRGSASMGGNVRGPLVDRLPRLLIDEPLAELQQGGRVASLQLHETAHAAGGVFAASQPFQPAHLDAAARRGSARLLSCGCCCQTACSASTSPLHAASAAAGFSRNCKRVNSHRAAGRRLPPSCLRTTAAFSGATTRRWRSTPRSPRPRA